MYNRRAVYGTNEMIVPQRSVLTLLIVEILNPFFVFQFFSFIIWCLDDYVFYASTIMVMTLFSVVGSGLSTYCVGYQKLFKLSISVKLVYKCVIMN